MIFSCLKKVKREERKRVLYHEMPIAYKDISVISEDIKSNNCSTPLFDATQKLYDIAKENVPATYDTGAVYEVYRQKLVK